MRARSVLAEHPSPVQGGAGGIEWADHIETVARTLLGEPNRQLSSKDELRFGSNGSLRVSIAGDHRGTWRDHEADASGGVLDLIVHKHGGDRRSAASWFQERFGERDTATTKRIVATYRYTDRAGKLVHEVVRFDPKEFRQRQPDGKGGYAWNMKGIAPTLYNLPAVAAAAERGDLVIIVEGEKDADRLNAMDLVATCNAGGAGKWKIEHSEQLAGATVAIIPDNDEAGRAHAEQVAASMAERARGVRIVELDIAERKADVSDWLDQGGSIDELRVRIERAQEWRPHFKPSFPILWFGDEDSRPALSWLVRGLIVDGGLALIYGAPKSTKTFLVLDMAMHIAHGRPWYGLPVRQGGVLYVCGEGEAGVRQRMKAWRAEREGDPSEAPFALLPQAINLYDSEEDVDRLILDIEGINRTMPEPFRLIIFDTFSRMIGSGEEDRAPDQNIMVARAKRIQDKTGATVLYVHHSGKDEARGARGSNALPGAADVVIHVSKDSDNGRCEAKVKMMKDGAEPGPFAYTLRQSTVGTDEEGEAIVSCVIEPTGASHGAQRTKRLTDTERKALDLLRDMAGQTGNVPVGTWRDKFRDNENGTFDARKKRAWRATKDLIDKGFVALEDDMARPVGNPQ